MLTRGLTTEHGEVVLIEYRSNGTPLEAVTVERDDMKFTRWYFTRSRHDGVTYVESESAGHHFYVLTPYVQRRPLRRVWHVDGLRLRHELRAAKPVATPRDYANLGLRRISGPLASEPFVGTDEVDAGALDYCVACEDHMDGGNMGFCRHLRWGDSGLVGPGAEENADDDVPEGFKWVVRAVGCARSLRRVLSGRGERSSFITSPLIGTDSIDLSFGGVNFSRAANGLHDARPPARVDVREGIAWLLGLDGRTRSANRLALAWLDEEIATQDARRASGEKCYAVRKGGWGIACESFVARGLSWAEALAALRAMPPDQTDRGAPRRATIVRLVHRQSTASRRSLRTNGEGVAA